VSYAVILGAVSPCPLGKLITSSQALAGYFPEV
jgi:hypothetical protein